VHSNFEYSTPLTNSIFSEWEVLDVKVVDLIVYQGARFTLPFFLLAIGFYYGKALQRGVDPFTFLILYGRKLLYIFSAWNLIYALIPKNFISEFKQFGIFSSIYVQLKTTYYWAINNKLEFILRGTKPHLWFIIACLVGLAITSIFYKYRIERFLIPFGAGLYLIGLLGISYYESPIGLSLPFDPHALLFPTIFIAVGIWISRHHEKNRRLALSLFFGGALMHFAEIFYIKKMYHMGVLEHNFLIGTIIWGIGAFLLCLEYPNAGQNSLLERMGKYTLGIYVTHIIILDALMPIGVLVKSLVWEILRPFFALFLSYGFCLGLARNRIFAKFLT
jgi:surface polysaccharide O-acyltransferase-like enzyme